MSPQYTTKETQVYNVFGNEMQKIIHKQNQSIGTAVEEIAEEMPDNAALYFQDLSYSWKELNQNCNKYSHFFLDLGAKPRDTIAIMLENSPEYIFLTTGINKIQCISALININQRKQALIHIFKISEPKWIIIDGQNLPFFNDIVSELPYSKDQIFVVNNYNEISHDFRDLSEEIKPKPILNPKTTYNSILKETSFYIFTSGTTGLPKAVNMENFKLFVQTNLLFLGLARIGSNDIIYIPTPLYHNLGIGVAWIGAFLTGAAVVLPKRFSASHFWKDIQKYNVTFTLYVGEIPRYLLNQPPSEFEKNHSLKKMLGLGLRKEIWEKFQSRFKVDHIFEFYGLTEGHRSLINADEVPGMIGRLSQSGLVMAKVDPETGEFFKNERGFCVKCRTGDIGMALIKIEKGTFFTGYKDKDKTHKKFMHQVFRKNDIYFNTGDMLKMHEDLWVSFADRFGDTFRWKGENVSTLEVESIINSYTSIDMSAVYGVSIPNTEGKAGMAAIKLNPSLKFDSDDFSRFIVDVFPSYSIPVFIRFRDELELTGPLKIKKTNLRQEAYDINAIKDQMLMWNSKEKKYVSFTNTLYQELMKSE